MKRIIFLLIFGFLIINLIFASGCSQQESHDLKANQSSRLNKTLNNELPNPASVYCQEQGYTLEIKTDNDGNQYGVCISDEKECEEWAYYHGKCILE